MTAIFEQLKGKLIVSCQASPGDPLEDTEAIRRIALATIQGGAAGLRLNGAAQVAAVRRETCLPIIGIEKQYGPRGLRITADFAAAAALASAGASLIALDCTDREWESGDPWRELVAQIHEQLRLPVMADIATMEEALAAEKAGVDCVGTTLYGYTEQTRGAENFSWDLLAEMRERLSLPIMAEGRLATPEEAWRAIDAGAWCVIVGSAITRPGTIAARFARALERGCSEATAIGIDIGGTSIKAALVRRNGEIGFSTQVPTEAQRGREAIVASLSQAIEETLAAAGQQNLIPTGAGIATAGVVDRDSGSIFAATDNLPGWTGFALRSFVEERFQLAAAVVNDAQAAAFAELHYGAGRGLANFAVITVGTGVGGGIVSEGKLLHGHHGYAGTFGHTVIVAGGRPCNCGRNGCLEAYVSTAALLREYREHGGVSADGWQDSAALALRINHLARTGDAAAQQAYAVLAEWLAEGIANIFNLFDPEAVLLAGGLIEDYGGFVTEVERRVTQRLHFGAKRRPRVAMATTGRWAGVQGAAALLFASVD
ncbi:MAG TPA: putative N-acetylmannosamine-6-phosphate 2-epimerase [Acidobacteriaceae bacterium]|jgi:glucokinase-like ROK family protein|nr:putative N-acetylmannosamine-6-phosphate 2-epimerase [Acidobacteriaceae bacterium]